VSSDLSRLAREPTPQGIHPAPEATRRREPNTETHAIPAWVGLGSADAEDDLCSGGQAELGPMSGTMRGDRRSGFVRGRHP
jgi:hypothetical protein